MVRENKIEQNRIEQNSRDSRQVIFACNELNINIDRPSVRGLGLIPVF